MRLIDADEAVKTLAGLTDQCDGEGVTLVKALVFAALKSPNVLPTIGGWVSVKDRMPDEDGSTLICKKNGKVCTARFYKQQGGWNAYAGRNAAYWMPLPEPPEGGADG